MALRQVKGVHYQRSDCGVMCYINFGLRCIYVVLKSSPKLVYNYELRFVWDDAPTCGIPVSLIILHISISRVMEIMSEYSECSSKFF